MKHIDLNNIEEAREYESLKPGGYVCGIRSVSDDPNKECLYIEYDIAEGKFKNYYYDLNKRLGFWGGTLYKSYKERALPFFKGFITAVEHSNAGFKWNDDERALVRKLCGFVLGEEEYRSKTGEIKTRLYVAKIMSADKIRQGNYEVPPLKKLPDSDKGASVVNSTFSDVEAVFNADGVLF